MKKLSLWSNCKHSCWKKEKETSFFSKSHRAGLRVPGPNQHSWVSGSDLGQRKAAFVWFFNFRAILALLFGRRLTSAQAPPKRRQERWTANKQRVFSFWESVLFFFFPTVAQIFADMFANLRVYSPDLAWWPQAAKGFWEKKRLLVPKFASFCQEKCYLARIIARLGMMAASGHRILRKKKPFFFRSLQVFAKKFVNLLAKKNVILRL